MRVLNFIVFNLVFHSKYIFSLLLSSNLFSHIFIKFSYNTVTTSIFKIAQHSTIPYIFMGRISQQNSTAKLTSEGDSSLILKSIYVYCFYCWYNLVVIWSTEGWGKECKRTTWDHKCCLVHQSFIPRIGSKTAIFLEFLIFILQSSSQTNIWKESASTRMLLLQMTQKG